MRVRRSSSPGARGAAVALAVTVAAGCAPAPVIRPAGGAPHAVASVTGLTITGEASAWSGDPDALPDFLTPVAITVTNRSGHDVRVAYRDFALLDDNGFRHAALDPYSGALAAPAPAPAALPAPPPAPRSDRAAPEPTLVLAAGGGPQVTRVAVGTGGLSTTGLHLGWTPGMAVTFAGPSAGPQRTPWFLPRRRGPPPLGLRGPRGLIPSRDVLRLGLPEGVLQPGGRISGFLYFRNAADHTRHLRLTWAATSPDGTRLAALELDFVVVR